MTHLLMEPHLIKKHEFLLTFELFDVVWKQWIYAAFLLECDLNKPQVKKAHTMRYGYNANCS